MAKAVAHPDAPYLGRAVTTAGQLLRLLEEQGLTGSAEQRVIDDPEFRTSLVAWWESNANPDTSSSGCSLAQAAEIMGDNFLGPVAVRRIFDPELVRHRVFQTVPFSIDQLTVCRETHVLVAVTALCVEDIFQMNPYWWEYGLLRPRHPVKYRKDQSFAYKTPEIGWYLIRTAPLPGSEKLRSEEAQALMAQNEFVPSVAMLLQAALLRYEYNDQRITGSMCVADRTDDGAEVCFFHSLSGVAITPVKDPKGLASAIRAS